MILLQKLFQLIDALYFNISGKIIMIGHSLAANTLISRLNY